MVELMKLKPNGVLYKKQQRSFIKFAMNSGFLGHGLCSMWLDYFHRDGSKMNMPSHAIMEIKLTFPKLYKDIKKITKRRNSAWAWEPFDIDSRIKYLKQLNESL